MTVAITQSIQAAINAAPNGGLVQLARGIHKPTAPIDTTNKSALRIEGLGGAGYNEEPGWGTVIQPTFAGPIFIDNGAGASVKHSGTKYRWLNLRPLKAGTVGWKLRNVNHVHITDCSANGPFTTVIDGDVPVSMYPNGDHAYNKAENLTVVNTQPDQKGFLLGDGFWWLVDCNWDLNGTNPVAITNLRGNVSVRGGKSNHAGTHFYSSGNTCDVVGMHMEQAPYTGAFIIVCEQGSNTLHGAGCYHKFIACSLTPHDDAYTPGAKLVRFGAGTYANAYPKDFNNHAYDKTGSFVDESGANTW